MTVGNSTVRYDGRKFDGWKFLAGAWCRIFWRMFLMPNILANIHAGAWWRADISVSRGGAIISPPVTIAQLPSSLAVHSWTCNGQITYSVVVEKSASVASILIGHLSCFRVDWDAQGVGDRRRRERRVAISHARSQSREITISACLPRGCRAR